MDPTLTLLLSPNWEDYQLLDSGNGQRLEKFGPYLFVRPDHQAVWHPNLSEKEWASADAVFQATGEESGGYWKFNRAIPPAWKMKYKGLTFWARTSSSRHLGVFPEQAVHWEWIVDQVRSARRVVNVLNLFGYTGLASLAAAQAGAKVTHVDASKKTISQAQENQVLSNLEDKPIRWIVDDAIKFVKREARRGVHYEGLILDPPKFGRGPKGEVWEFFKMMPVLIEECRPLLATSPLFIVVTAYAIRASALALYYALQEMVSGKRGTMTVGELVLKEQSLGRLLSMALTVRWSALTEK